MAKKDNKAKAAERKARVAAKAEKKSNQKEKKTSKKSKDADNDTDDEDQDLDAVLAAYAAEQSRYLAVTETIQPAPPSARSCATLLGSPTNSNELLLFGGEYYNGALAKFYNELFIYHIARDEWRLVSSPNSPLPRSGHAWCRAANKPEVYLFGGEFSSPKQGTFYHYSDFWRLDPASREWEKIEPERGGKGAKGLPTSPPARSGHRLTSFKQYIVLFGGFQDTAASTKYLSDLWFYDTQSLMWHSPPLPPASARPEPRSSFSFLPHPEGAVLYGGYSRVKATAVSKTKSKGGKSSASFEVLKPLVHTDVWVLRITPPLSEAVAGTLPTVRWEKRKRPVNAPNPPRAGATMAYHKGRGIAFGGVHDVENSEEGIESEFFNQGSIWNIDRNRSFELSLRRPRAQKAKVAAKEPGGRKDRGKRGEEELLENLRRLEVEAGVGDTRGVAEVDNDKQEGGEEEKVEKPVIWEMPHARFNAQLAVQNDVLYIYGGTFEKADREYTFDEMWNIDLSSLAGVKQIFKRELEDWQGEESESESEDEEDEEAGSSEEDEDDSATEPSPLAAIDEVRSPSPVASQSPETPEADISVTQPVSSAVSALADDKPHPRPFEPLRDFYARTSIAWQEILLDELKAEVAQPGKSIKEVRKGAFERAEEKWWDCREEIQALEDEQEESGIGEVINLADKATTAPAGGASRRR